MTLVEALQQIYNEQGFLIVSEEPGYIKIGTIFERFRGVYNGMEQRMEQPFRVIERSDYATALKQRARIRELTNVDTPYQDKSHWEHWKAVTD